MATRTITTRLSLEGESEYRAKIKNINSELATHKSELALVSSRYKDAANSMEALEAKQAAMRGIQESLNAKLQQHTTMLTEAQQAQDDYGEKVSQLSKRLNELKSSTGDTAEEEEKLKKELGKAQANLQAAQNSVTFYQRQVNKAAKDQKDFGDELDKVDRYMEEARQSTDGCASSIDKYGKEVREAGEKSEDFGTASTQAITALASTLASAGVAAGIREIAEALKECVDASVEFESAVTGVFKTVDGTPEQLQAISDGIKQMSTEIPFTTTAIAGVAEAAGQLGIATEDVLDFSRVMLDLGVSSNLSAEEAATAFARFANITGTAAEDYERLGSVVVGLGNNMEANEREITEMSTRLAAAGTLAKLTEPQIMALAAAMTSVGIEAEAGGTAMTQTLGAMEKAVAGGGDTLSQFAQIAGMSASEFSTAWETDAITAIQAFISGLGRLDEQGESATLVLEDLGLSGIRQSNMLKSLALASDTLTGAVDLANQAWTENTALAEEAVKFYETAESRFEDAQNAVTRLKSAIGDQLTPALVDLADAGGTAANRAAEFVEQNGWLVSAISGLFAAVVTLGTGLALLQLKVTLVTAAAKLLGTEASWAAVKVALLDAATKALSANPLIAVATAAVGVAVAVGTYVAALPNAEGKTDDFTQSLNDNAQAFRDQKQAIEDNAQSYKDMTYQLDELLAKNEKTAADWAMIDELCRRLSEGVDGLTVSYDEETGALTVTTEAMRGMIDAQADASGHDANVQALADAMAEQARIASELEEKTAALADAENRRNQMMADGTYWSMGYEMASQSMDDTINGLEKDIRSLTGAQEANGEKIEELTGQINGYAGAQENSTGKGEAVVSSMHKIRDSLDGVTQGYEKAKDAAEESIDKQMGLFKKVGENKEGTIDDLLHAQQSQLKLLDDYTANIQAVTEKGLDPEIIKQLTSEFTEENARILEILAEASSGEIQLANDQQTMIQASAKAAEDAVKAAQSGVTDSLVKLKAQFKGALTDPGFYKQSYATGENVARGLSEGMLSKEEELKKTAKRLAEVVNNAYAETAKIHSPSRVFADYGRYTVQGLIEGIGETEADLVRRVDELGKAAVKAASFELPQMPNLFSETAAQAAAVAGSLITVERAQEEERPPLEPIHIDMTLELDGAELARKTYQYNKREEHRQGRNLIDGEW